MKFSKALKLAKQGEYISRIIWDENKFVFLYNDTFSNFFSSIDMYNPLTEQGEVFDIKPTLCLVLDRTITLGWQSTSDDLLAEDWTIYG